MFIATFTLFCHHKTPSDPQITPSNPPITPQNAKFFQRNPKNNKKWTFPIICFSIDPAHDSFGDPASQSPMAAKVSERQALHTPVHGSILSRCASIHGASKSL